MMKSATEILETAARLLDERGWCRGELVDQDGKLCIMGAVQLAAGWEEITQQLEVFPNSIKPVKYTELKAPEWIKHARGETTVLDEAAMRIRFAIFKVTGAYVVNIPTWNDEFASSGKDVQLILRHAAADETRNIQLIEF